MGAMTSQITSLTIVNSSVYSGAETIKVPRHWSLCGEFTGNRWIPLTKASNAENVSIWWRHHDNVINGMSNIDGSTVPADGFAASPSNLQSQWRTRKRSVYVWYINCMGISEWKYTMVNNFRRNEIFVINVLWRRCFPEQAWHTQLMKSVNWAMTRTRYIMASVIRKDFVVMIQWFFYEPEKISFINKETHMVTRKI